MVCGPGPLAIAAANGSAVTVAAPTGRRWHPIGTRPRRSSGRTRVRGEPSVACALVGSAAPGSRARARRTKPAPHHRRGRPRWYPAGPHPRARRPGRPGPGAQTRPAHRTRAGREAREEMTRKVIGHAQRSRPGAPVSRARAHGPRGGRGHGHCGGSDRREAVTGSPAPVLDGRALYGASGPRRGARARRLRTRRSAAQ